jgi:hypothetical protein
MDMAQRNMAASAKDNDLRLRRAEFAAHNNLDVLSSFSPQILQRGYKFCYYHS